MLYYVMYLSINIILEFVLANEKEKIVVSDKIIMTVFCQMLCLYQTT